MSKNTREKALEVIVWVAILLCLCGAATIYACFQRKAVASESPLALEKTVEEADLTTESYTSIRLSLFGLTQEESERRIEEIVATWEKENPDRIFLCMELHQYSSTVVWVAIYSKPKDPCPG